MNYPSFDKQFQKFIQKHEEMINEYDSMNVDIFEDVEFDIYNILENLRKINKNLEFESIIYSAINSSLQNKVSIIDSLNSIMSYYTINNNDLSTTQRYFKEVNDIYIKNNNNYDIEYCEENRDKLIEMNLKSVISIAKNYQGLGLSLDELISAGNLGLCIAYDRYDPERAKLKDNMIAAAQTLSDKFKYVEARKLLTDYLTYGDVLEKFDCKFKTKNAITKEELLKWINKNVANAKFNSIANMWIRAYILIEIDNYSRIVRKPKAEIYKDAIEDGSYKVEKIINIDNPIGDDGQCTIGDMIPSDEEDSHMDVSDAYDIYKKGLNKLLDGVKNRDRSVFLKKFGIGLPRPLLPREIAQQEGLSIARVSQIFQTVIERMQLNAAKYDINIDELFEASRKLN